MGDKKENTKYQSRQEIWEQGESLIKKLKEDIKRKNEMLFVVEKTQEFLKKQQEETKGDA